MKSKQTLVCFFKAFFYYNEVKNQWKGISYESYVKKKKKKKKKPREA